MIGYREIGTGSPILLITGLSGTMDDWQPAFVASLATGHTVVMLDNAGVGETAPLAQPLTITAMANQTSALISTLGLGRVAVLGWSMGGMIAQALAVLHPAQVSKIVLAATQPGTGHAVPIPPTAAAEAASSNAGEVISVLFPPGDSAAAQAYVAGIIRYPDFYRSSSAVVADNRSPSTSGWRGETRRVPGSTPFDARSWSPTARWTRLDPSANDRSLAHSVPGGKLILYAGAGHAFMFQDMASFVPAVQRFLR